MSSEVRPLMREVYSDTCTKLIALRDEVCETVKAEAAKAKDVSLTESAVIGKAYELVEKGYSNFQMQASAVYKVPPWSEITSMFIVAAKNKHFYSSSRLLGEVIAIISGVPEQPIEQNNDWDWSQ